MSSLLCAQKTRLRVEVIKSRVKVVSSCETRRRDPCKLQAIYAATEAYRLTRTTLPGHAIKGGLDQVLEKFVFVSVGRRDERNEIWLLD